LSYIVAFRGVVLGSSLLDHVGRFAVRLVVKKSRWYERVSSVTKKWNCEWLVSAVCVAGLASKVA